MFHWYFDYCAFDSYFSDQGHQNLKENSQLDQLLPYSEIDVDISIAIT